MEAIFIRMLLGHLCGDYLLQSKSMALRKSEKGWLGWLWCLFHCIVYTASVCALVSTIRPIIVVLVFLSHIFIDRWSLASTWLKLIRGRDFFQAYRDKAQYWEIDLSFSCLVYAVVDNTMHLLLLMLIAKMAF
jgi:hypothetical protein